MAKKRKKSSKKKKKRVVKGKKVGTPTKAGHKFVRKAGEKIFYKRSDTKKVTVWSPERDAKRRAKHTPSSKLKPWEGDYYYSEKYGGWI